METNGMMNNGVFDWSGIIGLLVIAGIFGGGWGFGGNNAYQRDITNEFLFNNLNNEVRANALSINTTDRDVLENRYQNSLQTQTLSSQMASCCCDIKQAIANDGALTRAMIQDQTIQDLRDKIADKDREALATGLSYSTSISVQNAKNDILNSLGNYYPKIGINPYYVYGAGSYWGTTIQ